MQLVEILIDNDYSYHQHTIITIVIKYQKAVNISPFNTNSLCRF